MKLLLFLLLAALMACQSKSTQPVRSQSSDTSKVSKAEQVKLQVLDFHTKHRCKTCLAIENLSLKVVQDSFTAVFKQGEISFQALDIEDPQNAALVEKFEITGSALVLYDPRSNTHTDMTEFAFMNALSNEAKFNSTLAQEIKTILK